MLSREEVKKIAKLARLELAEEEIEKMQKDLSGILEHFNSLQKVKEKPQAGVTDYNIPRSEKITREDRAIVQNEDTNKRIIESFPDKKGTHNKVKAIF
jgi:aspartyl-tRNA(Asn)/glutamyl-tRNA(Gln) amidotransferase subunit C